MTIRVNGDATAVALAALTALVNVGGPGKLQLYAGGRPAISADITTQVLLVEFTFAPVAFQVPVSIPLFGATATAFPVIPQEAVASGQASFYRVLTGEGEVLWDGEITATGGIGDLIVNSTTVSQGIDIVVVSFSITLPS